jgi:hypothetical protein
MSPGELTPWQRARSRCWQDWLLLGEAGIGLIAARVMLKLVPTMKIIRWIQRPVENGTYAEPVNLEQLRWAVTAFSRNAPIRLVCFPQALALHAMLRRRRIASEVLYGAARSADGKLTAHAWLRCDGRVLVGGEVAGDFTVLDVWKPASESRQGV